MAGCHGSGELIEVALRRFFAFPSRTTLCFRSDVFMSTEKYSFLFSSLQSKQPNTARKVHIRRLYDILQLCIQRQDWARAKRAWAILARCREVDWRAMWTTSVLLLGEGEPNENQDTQTNGDRVRFLSVMMRQHPDEVSTRVSPSTPNRPH